MINSWSLRDEILSLTHRWPIPLLSILVGCLFGWGLAGFAPTPYRAESSLDVAFSDTLVVRNPDDYKNSQMGELNQFILSRDVLGETLSRLRNRDPYWNQISVRELEGQLATYWRNTGRWRLVAEDRDPEHAVQLARAWGEVAAEFIDVALFHAGRLWELQTKSERLEWESVEAQQRLVELDQVKAGLQNWRQGAETSGVDQVVLPFERSRLEALAARAVGLDQAGMELLQSLPVSGALVGEYLSWLDQVVVYIDAQHSITKEQEAILFAQTHETNQALSDSLKAAHGLTALTRVKPLPSDGTVALPVRWRTDTALIGGALGLLAWGLVWLGRPFLLPRLRQK
jgi:hypothetical protein